MQPVPDSQGIILQSHNNGLQMKKAIFTTKLDTTPRPIAGLAATNSQMQHAPHPRD
jgi:hypothetical protein